jgi:hypothetical protein
MKKTQSEPKPRKQHHRFPGACLKKRDLIANLSLREKIHLENQESRSLPTLVGWFG